MTPALAFRSLLTSINNFVPVFHNHIQGTPPPEFAWFAINDSESEETFDEDDLPDRVYFDLEIYAASLDRLDALEALLRTRAGFDGVIPATQLTVQDVEMTGQREDYTPQANADSLPPVYQAWRIIFHGIDVT